MPRLDGTGPEGNGPKTGRGMGNCSLDQDDINKIANENVSRRRPFGCGMCRGMRRGFGNRNR